MTVAEIYANVQVKSIDKTFTYKVPEKFNFLTAGWRVFVPFGGREKIDGFVVRVYEAEETDFGDEFGEVVPVFRF